MSSGKSRLCQWVDRALHWGAQRSWITGLRSHSQCEVVLGFRLRYLRVVCFVGLVLDNRVSYMLHKCFTTGLQPHPGGKVFGKHSTWVPLSHRPWNNAEKTVRAGREEPTHPHHETQGHNLPMSPWGKTKAVLTLHQQGNDMTKIVLLFLKFLSEKKCFLLVPRQ